MPTWPTAGSFPQKPVPGGWSGAPQSNLVSFQPEVGPPITRRRGSFSARVFNATFPPISLSQHTTFLTFYHTTLEDGNLAFDWTDPILGVSKSWKFTEPYGEQHDEGSKVTLTVKLVRLT